MAIIYRCCGMNVHAGSIVCGIYTIILYALTTVTCIHQIYLISEDVIDTTSYAIVILDSTEHLAIYYLRTIAAITALITSIVLLFALRLDIPRCLLPYVFALSIATMVEVVTEVILLCNMIYLFVNLPMFVLTEIGFFALRLLNIFCIPCVYSRYQNFKEGIVPGVIPGVLIFGPGLAPPPYKRMTSQPFQSVSG